MSHQSFVVDEDIHPCLTQRRCQAVINAEGKEMKY
jgi:hypothetical protein